MPTNLSPLLEKLKSLLFIGKSIFKKSSFPDIKVCNKVGEFTTMYHTFLSFFLILVPSIVIIKNPKRMIRNNGSGNEERKIFQRR
jgi:hypothetical protein